MIAVLLAAALAAHSWQFIGASNDAAMFVEDTSVVTRGDIKTVWITGISDPSSEMGRAYPDAYSMAAHTVDCANRTDAISHLFVYSSRGDILSERADVYPTAPIAPASAGELIFQYACKGVITTDRVRKLTTMDEVRSFGRNWLEVYDRLSKLAR